MRKGRRLDLAVSLAAILAATGGVVALRTIPAGADEPKDKEKAVDKDRRAAFIAAYDKGDAKAVAAFWTPDATYVDQDGREVKGRAAIQKMYEKVFADNKGAKLAIHVTSLKHLTPDVVLEDGVTEVTPAGGGFPAASRFAAVLVKKDGEWYVQRINEAEPQPASHSEHLEELEWLIGDWSGEKSKGESGSPVTIGQRTITSSSRRSPPPWTASRSPAAPSGSAGTRRTSRSGPGPSIRAAASGKVSGPKTATSGRSKSRPGRRPARK